MLESNIHHKGHDFRRRVKQSEWHKTVGSKALYNSVNNKVNYFISTCGSAQLE